MQRFIHISDLHFWRIVCNPLQLMNKRLLGNLNLALRRRHYIRIERARSFVERLHAIEADALLVGGDLTTTATEDEFRMAAAFLDEISGTGLPVYLIPGNHDVYTFESRRKRRLERYFGAWLEPHDMPVLSSLPGGAPLLRLATVRPNLVSSRGCFPTAHLPRIRTLLEQAGGPPLIVLAHYPVLPNPGAYPSGVMRRLGNAGRLRRVLGESALPMVYLAGHVHVFSHQRDGSYPNIEQVTANALFYNKRSQPGGFTEIVVRNGACMVYPWTYDGDWTRGPLSSPE